MVSIVIVSLAGFGIQDVILGSTGRNIATVGKEKISINDFLVNIENYRCNLCWFRINFISYRAYQMMCSSKPLIFHFNAKASKFLSYLFLVVLFDFASCIALLLLKNKLKKCLKCQKQKKLKERFKNNDQKWSKMWKICLDKP